MALNYLVRAVLLLASVSLPVHANDALESHHESDGCVHIPIFHSTNEKVFGKRAVQIFLANRSDVAYYARLSFGTPPQPQLVQLDTGSFELWVNPNCANLASNSVEFCNGVGRFETARSSTFTALNTGKELRYGIGQANISYVRDDITLPGSSAVLRQVQFGVASNTEDQFSGILGIGYGMGVTTRYPNFIDELVRQNVTKVKAFSVALGPKTEKQGVVVFGGVDTSKFAGPLTRLPVTPPDQSPDKVPRYWVAMKSISLTPPSGRVKAYAASTMQVFLDSGSTLTLLPESVVAPIAADFGAGARDANGFYPVDCSLAQLNGTLDFAFEGVTIKVPYTEMIRQSGSSCVLGLLPHPSFMLLGDTFMRSAYTVFDLENHALWMSQYTNCGATPAALASTASLASVVGACGARSQDDDGAEPPSSSLGSAANASPPVGSGTTPRPSAPGPAGTSPAGAGAVPGSNAASGTASPALMWSGAAMLMASVLSRII